MQHQQMVDIRGMCCSAPVIRLAKEFAQFRSGEVVLVISDKISMLNDIPAWCNLTGNGLMKAEQIGELHHFWIEKR
ncbi:MAG TPA: sulfurtransferase TusA family protein [Gammaproteobacteria bacterium]